MNYSDDLKLNFFYEAIDASLSDNKLLTETPTSDQFEEDIAGYFNAYFSERDLPYFAQRAGNVKESDVRIVERNSDNQVTDNVVTFIEAKMNSNAQLGSGRLEYRKGIWYPMAKNARAGKEICGVLNNCPMADQWIKALVTFIAQYSGSNEISIARNLWLASDKDLALKGELTEPIRRTGAAYKNYLAFKHKFENTTTATMLRAFVDAKIPVDTGTPYYKGVINSDNPGVYSRYISNLNSLSIPRMVMLHYTEDKATPAAYLHSGDNLYQFKRGLNPLKFRGLPLVENMPDPPDPTLSIKSVRMIIRGHGSDGYARGTEIFPTLKMPALPDSAYSINPNSSKKLPEI